MSGTDMIAAERTRQIEAEGWTPEHDAEHDDDALVMAAVCYALPIKKRPLHAWVEGGEDRGAALRFGAPLQWPWHSRYWKPTPDDRVRELVKAGALIAAEIDRLLAASPS